MRLVTKLHTNLTLTPEHRHFFLLLLAFCLLALSNLSSNQAISIDLPSPIIIMLQLLTLFFKLRFVSKFHDERRGIHSNSNWPITFYKTSVRVFVSLSPFMESIENFKIEWSCWCQKGKKCKLETRLSVLWLTSSLHENAMMNYVNYGNFDHFIACARFMHSTFQICQIWKPVYDLECVVVFFALGQRWSE